MARRISFIRKAETLQQIWEEIAAPLQAAYLAPKRARSIQGDLFYLTVALDRYLATPGRSSHQRVDPTNALDPLRRAWYYVGSRGRRLHSPYRLTANDGRRITAALNLLKWDAYNNPKFLMERK